jgi:hypothetical protein
VRAGRKTSCLYSGREVVSNSMESRGRHGGIGADIGCGGARESSRQSGRNAEKAADCQSARGSLPNSASPPPARLPQQPPRCARPRAAAAIALCLCTTVCPRLRDTAADSVAVLSTSATLLSQRPGPKSKARALFGSMEGPSSGQPCAASCAACINMYSLIAC